VGRIFSQEPLEGWNITSLTGGVKLLDNLAG
jgi:hypothetical protein